MRLSSCHLVPAFAVLSSIATTSCYLVHGLGGDPPVTRDAGPTPLPPPLSDAGTPPPPPPPPPGCVPAAADFACSDTGTGFVPVGTPYELPVYFGDGERCWCGEQLHCVASITAPGVLDLSTYECAEFLCDGCFPFVQGHCPLPPLTEGRWHVRMNGLSVFDLEASNATPGVGPVDVCRTHPRDSLSCGWEWGPMDEPTDQICHPIEAVEGQPIPVSITDFCHSCGELWGPCTVTRTANQIDVRPSSVWSSCDVDCPVECALDETLCMIPPLEPGEYTISLSSLPSTTRLLVSPAGSTPRPGTACNSIDED